MQRIVLTYGFIGGGILAALFLLAIPFQDQIGFERGAIVGYTSMVAAFLMVYFGVRACRDAAGGTLTFGQAFRAGALISALITACYVLTWEIARPTLMPDFMDKYAAFALEKARASGASESELARQSKEMADFVAMYANPLVRIGFTVLEPLPVALVFTLVTAGVLGRVPKTAATSPRLASRLER